MSPILGIFMVLALFTILALCIAAHWAGAEIARLRAEVERYQRGSREAPDE